MRGFIHTISEEIAFYERQNFRLQMEDLLNQIEGTTPSHQQQIAENKARIERLREAMMEVF